MLMDTDITPDSKVHGANMGPIWGRQDPCGPHVGPMNFVIRDTVMSVPSNIFRTFLLNITAFIPQPYEFNMLIFRIYFLIEYYKRYLLLQNKYTCWYSGNIIDSFAMVLHKLSPG